MLIPDDIAIYETNGENPAKRELMLKLYPEWFPQYGYYVPYMAYRTTKTVQSDPRFIERWWFIERENEPAGLSFYKYIKARHFALDLGLAVVPKYRHYHNGDYQRLSQMLIDLSVDRLVEDSRAAGLPTPLGLVFEVESPNLVRAYEQYGFVVLPIDYYEPPFVFEYANFLSKEEFERIGFHPMQLGIFPVKGTHINPNDPALLRNIVFGCLVDHYGLDEDHWAVQRTLESIIKSQ